MKRICTVLAAALLLSAPLAAHAQPRGGDRGGGGRGGPSADGGGFRGGGDGGRRSADGASRAAAPSRDPASGTYRGQRYGGYRGGADRRGGYGYRPYWGALDLGFALGYSLNYPWYGGPWDSGFYGPGYVYGYGYGAPPAPYYDDPFARDYGTSTPPPAARDDRVACGVWVWNAGQSKYDWSTAGCHSTADIGQ